ncbi:MAG: aquaporin [candidate division KSB1 bacterium]|nr:aquaporin [candidate division KSB1 bacterium]MDZ7366907.1 aquaporin [candidate division KSB1 bacterium]MDZ7406076.1 aquaporin [candidate division KSB1 bacterium]
MKNYVVEFIGTFFLVLVIGLTVIEPGAGALAPLAIGSTLMVMVYAGGHISGGHYNPAVTLAVWMRGKCDTKDVAPYMIAQILGGVVAALVVGFCKPDAAVTAASPDVVRAVLVELLFTFALCYVVLNTATSKKNAGNSYYGLAIGFTVVVGAYAGGAISGGAYNPAVAGGISTMGLSMWSNIWIFLVGNFAGAALAAVIYKMANPGEFS